MENQKENKENITQEKNMDNTINKFFGIYTGITCKPAEKMLIKGGTYYDSKSKSWTASKYKGQETTIPYPTDSIGTKVFGLMPIIFRITMPGKGILFNSRTETENAMENWGFTDKLFFAREGGVIACGFGNNRTYTIDWSKIGFAQKTIATRVVLEQLGIPNNIVIPGHPSWLTSNEQEHEIYIPMDERSLDYVLNYRKVKSSEELSKDIISWERVAKKFKFETKSSMMRAGKDIWSKPLVGGEWKHVRLQIVASNTKAEDDGDFYLLRNTFPNMEVDCLARGWANGYSKVIKGAATTLESIEMIEATTGYSIDKSVDGITTLDNLKWKGGVEPTIGSIVEMDIYLTKKHEADAKDSYGFNLVNLIILSYHLDKETYNKLMGDIESQFRKTSDKLGQFDKKGLEMFLDAIDEEDDDTVQLQAKVAKYLMGYATDEDKATIQRKYLKRCASLKINESLNCAVLVRESWMGMPIERGNFFLSQEAFEEYIDKGGEETCTIMRYPVASYQSFARFEFAYIAEGLRGRYIIINPKDVSFFQADCDDHMQLYTRINTSFTGKEEALIGRGNIPESVSKLWNYNYEMKDLGFDSLDEIELMYKGTYSQGLVGQVFNPMVKCIANAIDKAAIKGEKWTKTRLNEIYAIFGGALDASAQGIKKNYALPDAGLLRFKAGQFCGTIKQHVVYNPVATVFDECDYYIRKDDRMEPGDLLKKINCYIEAKAEGFDEFDMQEHMMAAWGIEVPSLPVIEKKSRSEEYMAKVESIFNIELSGNNIVLQTKSLSKYISNKYFDGLALWQIKAAYKESGNATPLYNYAKAYEAASVKFGNKLSNSLDWLIAYMPTAIGQYAIAFPEKAAKKKEEQQVKPVAQVKVKSLARVKAGMRVATLNSMAINEMAGAIVNSSDINVALLKSYIMSGDKASAIEMIAPHIDSAIFGNRFNSPVFRSWLLRTIAQM